MARGWMGLRPSEARNADLADYWFDPGDENSDILTVRKSNPYRLIPTPSQVSAWAREHHPVSNLRAADTPAVPLFVNPDGLERIIVRECPQGVPKQK